MGRDRPGKKILWEELLGIYEDHLSDKLGELLSSEKFIRGLQLVLTTSEEFRRFLLKVVEVALANLELPTGQDFARLYDKVSDMDDSIFELRSAIHELRRTNESLIKEIKALQKKLEDTGKSTKKSASKTSSSTTKKSSAKSSKSKKASSN